MKQSNQKPSEIPMNDKSWFQSFVQNVQQQAFYNSYHKTFEIVEAQTDAQRDQAYALRYDVFCRENGFLDPADYPDGRERDEFDERAVHHLLIHRETGKVAGTVRVLLPDPHRPLTSFELQKLCDHPLLQLESRAGCLAEISRLCMSADFRRRPRDGRILPSYYEQELTPQGGKKKSLYFLRRRIPYAPLGLMMAAYDTILSAGLLDVVTMADPAQFRTLKRVGLSYRVLGPRLRYLGTQQPFIFNIKTALDTMNVENPESWEVVSDQGRLHNRANQLLEGHWQDEIFDEVCKEMILRRMI